MSWGRLIGIGAIALLAGVACQDDVATSENAAGASGAAGAAGAGAASAAGAAGADACEGDVALWATLVAAPPACQTDADCCVVVNSCLAEAQIVHADDFDAAQSAWPYCDADCVDCVPPVVRVACDDGHCVGKVDAESTDDGVSHCGDTVSMAGSPGQSFSCNDH